MIEIEYSVIRARGRQQLFIRDNVTDHFRWCLDMGLWETCGWISDKNRSKVFGWLILG